MKKNRFLNKKFIIFTAIFQGLGVTFWFFYILITEIFLGNGNGIHILYLNKYGEMIPLDLPLVVIVLVVMIFGLKYSYSEWILTKEPIK